MIEIERKFLVDPKRIPRHSGIRITQGYLSTDPERTVRIRVCGFDRGDMVGNISRLTIKGKSDDHISRPEYEYDILPQDGLDMLEMCIGIIDKTRYLTEVNNKIWEIDVFHGDNEGLIIAEVELDVIDEPLIIPDWVTQEVTGDVKYYNSRLSSNPYKDW